MLPRDALLPETVLAALLPAAWGVDAATVRSTHSTDCGWPALPGLASLTGACIGSSVPGSGAFVPRVEADFDVTHPDKSRRRRFRTTEPAQRAGAGRPSARMPGRGRPARLQTARGRQDHRRDQLRAQCRGERKSALLAAWIKDKLPGRARKGLDQQSIHRHLRDRGDEARSIVFPESVLEMIESRNSLDKGDLLIPAEVTRSVLAP